MKTSFRMCRLEDAEQLCGLIRTELGYSEVTPDKIRISLEKILSLEDYFTLTAFTENEICGYISAVREYSLESGMFWRVLALAVKREFQGKGIGTALLTHVEGKARVDGAALITLSSQFKRTEAHSFYEKLGYEKTSYSLKKYFGTSSLDEIRSPDSSETQI